MGRFVGFKNLPVLLEALSQLPDVRLTLVGEGPMREKLEARPSTLLVLDPEARTRGGVKSSKPEAHVHFLAPVHGEEKRRIFADHDLLVLPSLTEISPHVALEARAAGLPVLLTGETGLSSALRQGMVIADLSTPAAIAAAIREVMTRYDDVARHGASPPPKRDASAVAEAHLTLLSSLCSGGEGNSSIPKNT